MFQKPKISTPLVKRPDTITYNGVEFILFSDPIGESFLNYSFVPERHNLIHIDSQFDKFWNLQGRGFYVDWVFHEKQLKINKFLGYDGLKETLVKEGYFKHIESSKKGAEALRSDDHMLSKIDECLPFEPFTGELRLLDVELLNAARVSWLVSPQPEVILDIASGEIINATARNSFFRLPRHHNFCLSNSHVEGTIFDQPHFNYGFMAKQERHHHY